MTNIYLSSQIIFDYSYLLRGYYISSLIFCYIFYLLLKNLKKPSEKDLKIVFLLCAFQILNNISSLYLVVPILLAIFFNFNSFFFKKKIILFLTFFLFFFIFINSIQILVTGLYFDNFYDLNIPLTTYILQNFFDLYINGFKSIYFKDTLRGPSLFHDINYLLLDIKNNSILFSIFIISLLILFFNIFKKKLIVLDYIVLYFFLFFVLINKIPPDRVYIGFIFFFIFYIFNFLKEYNINKLRYLILIPSFLLIISNNQPLYKSKKINILINTEINVLKKFKCDLSIKNLKEIETHFYYYLYLNKCNKKRNLNEFVNFYRNSKL